MMTMVRAMREVPASWRAEMEVFADAMGRASWCSRSGHCHPHVTASHRLRAQRQAERVVRLAAQAPCRRLSGIWRWCTP